MSIRVWAECSIAPNSVSILPLFQQIQGDHLPAFMLLRSLWNITVRLSHTSSLYALANVILLAYSRTYDQFNPIENEDGHVCDKYVFVHDSQETQTPQFQSRRRRMLVDERQVNFDLIRRWLQECETEHRDACNTHKWETVTETPPILRVIDVQNNCLCSAPPNCRYTTLSYVWSKNPRTAKLFKQNIAHLSEKDGLLGYFDNMPQTVCIFS
jgi:hypothetical protein